MFRRLDATTTWIRSWGSERTSRRTSAETPHTLLLEYSASEEQIQANILYKRSGTTVSPQSRSSSVGGHVITGFISELNVFEKFAQNEITPFYLVKYADNIWKIDKVLGTRSATIYNFRTPGKLGIRASPFFYLTLGVFNFFKYSEGFHRLSKNCFFKLLWNR